IADAPVEITSLRGEDERESFIEILAVRGGERVVTTIELLSHTNKSGSGRKEYRAKQTEILASDSNLIEVDLLRSGEYTVAVPQYDIPRKLPPNTHWDYLVCLHRAGVGPRYSAWPRSVRQPLPRIRVPL